MDSEGYDEKNIRRRVYDAFNVLQAIKVIKKQGKEITWVGRPQEQTQQILGLRQKRKELIAENERKQQCLRVRVILHFIYLYMQSFSIVNLLL